MRRNKKQVTTYFILFSLLLIGVVYAILQANLQINGTAKIQANTWDIHFDNIQVNENSVSIGNDDSAATIDPENNCKVDFEVTLSIPGDFYEFTIDVVNAGTIDAMIGTLNKTLKVNNEVVEDTPDYLSYAVTYSDGVEIEENHKIEAGTTETYKVRLEFKTDIEELPQATTITTSLEPQYIQADSSAKSIQHYKLLYNVLKDEKTNNTGLVYENSDPHKDSFTVTGTEKIYYWRSINSANTELILNKWNVIFGGFCWQAYRTTDTGGVKIIYNGLPVDGKCTATGENQQIGTSKFNNNTDSPAYVGYMYNPDLLVMNKGNSSPEGDSLFGTNVNYNNGMYTLTDISTTYDDNHHYSCNNTSGTCEYVRYYYYLTYYYELRDGRNIIEVLDDMLSADNVNQVDSAIKTIIETWYENNMTAYTTKLEDTIFCNNRKITNRGNWNPSGGSTSTLGYITFDNSESLKCTNETDEFCLSNPKAHLNYPVGLMTYAEALGQYNVVIKKTGSDYWLFTAGNYKLSFQSGSRVHSVATTGHIGDQLTDNTFGVRPVVSLKPGTMYRLGDGSKNNPYIIE